MEKLYGQVVFTVGGDEYRWDDVVLAADLRGEWTRVRDRLRQGLACLRASEEREEGPEESEIESAASEFRYSRDLVAAQEMEDWLTRWNVTAKGWMDYVRWSLLRQKWADRIADFLSEYSPEDGEVDSLIHVEAVCSGDLDRFASDLAGRAAVSEVKKSEPEEAEVADVLRQFTVRRTERGLAGIDPGSYQAKMERLARLEVSFRRFREQAATPRKIAALIRSRRIDWTRLDLDSISFPEQQTAREAALCVREDGRTLAEVAADARRELRQSTMYIEEMETTLRDGFIGAQKGELLGPFQSGQEFVLHQVRDKRLPSAGDAALTDRARQAVLQLQLDREINDRVKWARPA